MSHESFVDREVRALSSGAQLTLWCGRVWARHTAAGKPALPCLRHGLELAGVGDALEDVSAVFTLIERSASGTLGFGGCRCHPITPDEARLLDAVRIAQAERPGTAADTFAAWMPPVAARDAALHAGRFAGCMAAAALPVGLAGAAPSGPARLH
jgi:hypothetical protein